MKILVAVPAYDGKLDVETVRALLNEQVAASIDGDVVEVAFLPGCSLITHARNQLAGDFMKSDAERLVFVDSDVGWELGALLKVAKSPVDFVGGAYRYKSEDEGYPVHWFEHDLWADPKTGLLEVKSLPGGFLSLSRSVFERLKAAFPQRSYTFKGQAYQGYFHAPIEAGELFGEDGRFCADWREIGGKVWLDPELTLKHVGGRSVYEGRIGDWLRGRA